MAVDEINPAHLHVVESIGLTSKPYEIVVRCSCGDEAIIAEWHPAPYGWSHAQWLHAKRPAFAAVIALHQGAHMANDAGHLRDLLASKRLERVRAALKSAGNPWDVLDAIVDAVETDDGDGTAQRESEHLRAQIAAIRAALAASEDPMHAVEEIEEILGSDET
jgi:hypothetical protein